MTLIGPDRSYDRLSFWLWRHHCYSYLIIAQPEQSNNSALPQYWISGLTTAGINSRHCTLPNTIFSKCLVEQSPASLRLEAMQAYFTPYPFKKNPQLDWWRFRVSICYHYCFVYSKSTWIDPSFALLFYRAKSRTLSETKSQMSYCLQQSRTKCPIKPNYGRQCPIVSESSGHPKHICCEFLLLNRLKISWSWGNRSQICWR